MRCHPAPITLILFSHIASAVTPVPEDIPPPFQESITIDDAARQQALAGHLQPWHEDSARAEEVREIRRLKFRPPASMLPDPPAYMLPSRSSQANPTPEQLSRINAIIEGKPTDVIPGQVARDHYIVLWKDEVFPYSLKPDLNWNVDRVHLTGVTLNQLSEEVVASLGGELTYTYNIAIPGFAAFLTPSQAEELRGHPDVERVERDVTFQFSGDAGEQIITDPDLWGLDRIDEHNISNEDVYRYPRTGAGVHAYVIDSGIRVTHDEFTNRIGASYGSGATTPSSRHGTHVAGILGGETYGVAKGVTIHPVKHSNLSNLISLIGWIITVHESTANPAVVNMSFTASEGRIDPPGTLAAFEAAVDALIEAGFVVIVAAGNKGSENLGPPASYQDVITVGAIDSNDTAGSWFNPDLGDGGTWEASNKGSGVDIWAPGVSIRSADYLSDSGSRVMTGTSMAAPHVAGVASLYLEAHPTAGHHQTKAFLVSNALVGKVSGDIGVNGNNRLLFYNGWLYPFNTLSEWQNSDDWASCETNGCWFYREEMGGWVWTDETSYLSGPWFYRNSDDTWVMLLQTTPCVLFYNDNTASVEPCIDQ